MESVQASLISFSSAQDGASKVKKLGLFLVAANLIVWAWAWFNLQTHAALLGTATLAYSFGLRHALDADHIAAIDNVTRKLMQDGKRPVGVGFYFAFGHSLVVVLASVMIAFAAKSFTVYLPQIQQYGGLLSTGVSSTFLLLIGLFNVFLLTDLYRTYRLSRNRNEAIEHANLRAGALKGNLLARLCAPIFGKICHSWQMMPLGFLFGLGFETATEVALLSTSAVHAAQGADMATILLFPALFTVGMLTVDAADGILMLRVYGWAFVHPVRKLYYNLVLTFLSTLLAFAISTIGVISLFHEHFNWQGKLWQGVQAIQDNYLMLSYIIIGIFLLSWLGSSLAHHLKSSGTADPTV